MAAMLGVGGALLGGGSALAGIFGGTPSQNVQLPPQFNMPNMPQAAGGAFNSASTLAGMPNIPQQLYPQFSSAASNILQNPGAGGMLQGAQGAASAGAGAAGNAYGMGQFLSGAGGSMLPYANQIMQTGFDPQNALYDRTQHQLQDQVRASNAATGTGMSPFGAGVENKAMSDFNIDWQNNQLGRQSTAAGAAGGLLGAGGGAITAGNSMMAGAPGMLSSTSMLPYMAYNQIGGDQFNALNTLSSAGLNQMTTPQMQQQAWMQYLQGGNQAGQVANQQAQVGVNQANSTFQQQQMLGQNLGKSLASLGGFFPSGGSGGSSSVGGGSGGSGASSGWG